MDYDYLSSIVSNYTNLSSLTNQATSALSGASSVGSMLTELAGSSSFSSILSAAMQSTGVDDDIANSLQNIASVYTNSGMESEARSELIMQNYLYAALMKDTLQNSLTDAGDFTSSLFQSLAVGNMDDEDESGSTTLGSLQNSTLNAISNLSAYDKYLKTDTGELDTNFQELAAKYGLSDLSKLSGIAL
ncbi:MAG: hypothetical protein E7302_04820 [Butyrivibrio sp.]|nr:hypothetical protein [Butyrivibrio sp.]